MYTYNYNLFVDFEQFLEILQNEDRKIIIYKQQNNRENKLIIKDLDNIEEKIIFKDMY